MKISVLAENCAGSHFLAEHGLSYLIEIDGEKILFDTGHSDVFLKNEALGVELYCSDAVDLDLNVYVKKIEVRNLQDKPRQAYFQAIRWTPK